MGRPFFLHMKKLKMNNLINLPFEGTTIRTLNLGNGNFVVVASDVAKLLGYRGAGNLTRLLDEDEKGTHLVSTLGGSQEMTCLTESGIYHAILISKRPEAKKFRRFVTEVILPEIRKTGQYGNQDKRLRSDASEHYKVLTDALKDEYEDTHDGRHAPSYIYSNDANLLNKIVFGKTAKQWREENAIDAANGLNIRDKATPFELALLSLLEMKEMMLVHDHVEYQERKILLEKEAHEFKRMLPFYNKILLVSKK